MSALRPTASTRVRLTAWYAALLVLVLLALGLSVDSLARNRLMEDVDLRLVNTAEDIGSSMKRQLERWPFSGEVSFEQIAPNLGSFASRGLLIQITAPHGQVARRSEYAPEHPLIQVPAKPSDEPEYVTTTWNGDELRAVHYPVIVTDPDGVRWLIGAVIVGERLTTTYETLISLRQILVVTSGLGLALALAGGWVLAGRALRPVDRVTAAAAAIAAGDGTATSLQARLPVPPTKDELARLSATFNAMLERLEASFRTQERFVADASHELRTPLTAIRGNVDVLIRQARAGGYTLDPEDLKLSLSDIRRESDRMRRLLDDLLLLARADAGPDSVGLPIAHRELVRLDDVAVEAMRSAEAMSSGQMLELEAPRPVDVVGDPDRLHQLIMILLDNAVRHTPAGGRVRVAVAAGAAGAARLAVRDEGEGIDPAHLPHIFERFYRADGARGRASGGTGLGLAIARAICQAHGGDITVMSAAGRGTTFVVSLPRAGDPSNIESLASDREGLPAMSEPDYRVNTRRAAAPPTITTKATGKISPATDSFRKPRP